MNNKGSIPTRLTNFMVVYNLNLSEKKIIKIVVSDKSPLIQVGLRTLFGCDKRFALVGTAEDGEQFMEEIGRINFDIGIIGWEMPYLNGLVLWKCHISSRGNNIFDGILHVK